MSEQIERTDDIDEEHTLSESLSISDSSSGSFERVSDELLSDDDYEHVVYMQSSQNSPSVEESSYLEVTSEMEESLSDIGRRVDLTSSFADLSVSLSSSSHSWSELMDNEDRATPKPPVTMASLTSSISPAYTSPNATVPGVSESSPAASVAIIKSKDGSVAKKDERATIAPAAVTTKEAVETVNAYPSPATTPKPTHKQTQNTPVKSKDGHAVKTNLLSSAYEEAVKFMNSWVFFFDNITHLCTI